MLERNNVTDEKCLVGAEHQWGKWESRKRDTVFLNRECDRCGLTQQGKKSSDLSDEDVTVAQKTATKKRQKFTSLGADAGDNIAGFFIAIIEVVTDFL